MKQSLFILAFAAAALCGGCEEPYTPPTPGGKTDPDPNLYPAINVETGKELPAWEEGYLDRRPMPDATSYKHEP